MSKEKAMKLNYKLTFLIGFGFLASSIAWSIYNAYVPLILNERLRDVPFIMEKGILGTVTGFIMTIDNIFGVIFQPLFGKFSDGTRTKIGKRIPYMLVGIPLSVLFFILIPTMKEVWMLMICVILFNLIMSLWRSPVVALMPDMTPPSLRSEGNAVINLMGGVGTLLGMVSGTICVLLFRLDPKTGEGRPYVFVLGGIVMILSLLVVGLGVHEPDNRLKKAADAKIAGQALAEESQKAKRKTAESKTKLGKKERMSLLFMLAALFFVFNGTDSIQTFFTTFATKELHLPESQATLMMAMFAGSLMLFAIPAGKLGQKIGRKKTILLGLGIILSMFLLYFLTKSQVLIYVALILGGGSVAFININTLPMVLEIGGKDKMGTFTGYYYTATFSASIVGPILCGRIFDVTGTYWSLFIYCPIAFALAIACILFVKHGESRGEELAPDDLIEA